MDLGTVRIDRNTPDPTPRRAPVEPAAFELAPDPDQLPWLALVEAARARRPAAESHIRQRVEWSAAEQQAVAIACRGASRGEPVFAAELERRAVLVGGRVQALVDVPVFNGIPPGGRVYDGVGFDESGRAAWLRLEQEAFPLADAAALIRHAEGPHAEGARRVLAFGNIARAEREAHDKAEEERARQAEQQRRAGIRSEVWDSLPQAARFYLTAGRKFAAGTSERTLLDALAETAVATATRMPVCTLDETGEALYRRLLASDQRARLVDLERLERLERSGS